MSSRAGARLIDWSSASKNARLIAGAAPKMLPGEADLVRADLRVMTARAEELVADRTGLALPPTRARAWVVGRGQWIDANLRSLERIMGPLLDRLVTGKEERKGWRSKALGAQVGGLLGYVSRKVIGQYDVFLPPDDEDLIYFVGPNVVSVERKLGFDPADFRLWVAVHEVTHRAQFTAAPWLRGYLAGMVDAYLSTIDIDPKKLIENLTRGLGDLVQRDDAQTVSLILSMMTPEQRAIFGRMQALMSVVEGHASYVMNVVGEEHIPSLPNLKKGLAKRRRSGGMERTFQKAIGFDQKLKQYSMGEAFVARVVERSSMGHLNLVWQGPQYMPTLEEMSEPDRWLARVK